MAGDLRSGFEPLVDVALKALPQMLDEQSGLFSHKAVVDGGRLVNRGGSNPLYSAMSMVGILTQPKASPDEVVPVGRALDALHTASRLRSQPGILGNILWASALAGDERGRRLVAELAETVRPKRLDGVSLAHALNGVVAAAERWPEEADRARGAAERWVPELLAHFSPRAELFGPSPRIPTGFRTARSRRITSFAAQVYPLHALAAYHRWTGTTPAPQMKRVADRIVEAQGPLGQWWWIYSPVSRTVIEGYPVYSVHQDGMAFMGLEPLERLGIGSYREPLALGLDWLLRGGELSAELWRTDPPIVYRCIQRKGSDADGTFGISRANFRRVLARSLRPGSLPDQTVAPPETLEVLHESRSYHLGWLLYAYSLVAA
jgi:hypothetical protein